MTATTKPMDVAIRCKRCGSESNVTPTHAKWWRVCNACLAADKRNYRRSRREEGRPVRRAKDRSEYERQRSQRPDVRAMKAANMRRSLQDPAARARHEARWAVRREVAAKRMNRQPCEQCGELQVHGHHDDYTKPLEVRWLCPPCHRDWHKNNTPIYPAIQGENGGQS